MDINDTIVALSTPPGRSALAMLRVSGRAAHEVVNRLTLKHNLTQQPPNTTRLYALHSPDAPRTFIDEAVVAVYRAPASFTGQHMVEISCHGSTFIIEKLLHELTAAGARLAQPGEFTKRAFMLGKLSLLKAEAIIDLIDSENERAHQMAVNQMKGKLAHRLGELRQQFIDFAALLELELDFSEEDVEFADRSRLTELLTHILTEVNRLKDSFRLGNAIKKGFPVVIAGRPNAGKSTLLNAILEEEKAIVSNIAGTTRDTIEDVYTYGGFTFRFIDTAGIRDTTDQVEQLGIARAFEKIKQAGVVVYIFDASQTSPEAVQADLSTIAQQNPQVVAVANKTDLAPDAFANLQLQFEGLLGISALGNQNIDALKEAILQRAKAIVPHDTSFIIANQRHHAHLSQAAADLQLVLQGLSDLIPTDLLATHVRSAIAELGAITGEVDNEEILGSIFSRFCIGK